VNVFLFHTGEPLPIQNLHVLVETLRQLRLFLTHNRAMNIVYRKNIVHIARDLLSGEITFQQGVARANEAHVQFKQASKIVKLTFHDKLTELQNTLNL